MDLTTRLHDMEICPSTCPICKRARLQVALRDAEDLEAKTLEVFGRRELRQTRRIAKLRREIAATSS